MSTVQQLRKQIKELFPDVILVKAPPYYFSSTNRDYYYLDSNDKEIGLIIASLYTSRVDESMTISSIRNILLDYHRHPTERSTVLGPYSKLNR